MSLKKTWKSLGKFVYGAVGITAVVSLLWAFFKIANGSFFETMGFFGSLGFFLLAIGGLNWGIKLIRGKDLFGN